MNDRSFEAGVLKVGYLATLRTDGGASKPQVVFLEPCGDLLHNDMKTDQRIIRYHEPL